MEKPSASLKALQEYWLPLLQAELYERWSVLRWVTNTKPFDKNEAYKIADKLGISPKHFPCLVLLPPLKKLSSEEKLIIPIREVSTEYFRHLFSILKDIVDSSEEMNKYKEIKINFGSIIRYLENNSKRILQQTTTEYNIGEQNFIVNSQVERKVVMNENSPNIDIRESNVASVTGEGTIGTAITNQYNYSTEQKQTLTEAAKEIEELLAQLAETYSPPSAANNAIVAAETVQKIEGNPTLKSKIVNALEAGGVKALKELIKRPEVDVFLAAIEGWKKAK